FQAAHGLDVSLGVLAQHRLQYRLQRRIHRVATARGHRLQLPARRRVAAARQIGEWGRRTGRVCAHGRDRRGHVHTREAGHECVRARGWCGLPHLFHLCARPGRPVGHVPVARPRSPGAQRVGPLVAPPRQVRRALSMGSERALHGALFGVSALVFAASAALTAFRCGSMSAMGEMPMPGGWAMSMTWMRMPGQTWPGAAASFLGMWVVMMVAMMLPSLAPMLRRYREAVGGTAARHLGALTAIAGAGYFFVWTVFGMAVFPLGAALAAIEMQQPALARAVPGAARVVGLSAGVLQFTA